MHRVKRCLKTYKDYATLPNAQKVCEKTISVVDLIKKIKFVCNKNLKIAVHKPCHDDYDFIDIVKNIDGITYVEAEDFDKCCGFSANLHCKIRKSREKFPKSKHSTILKKYRYNTDNMPSLYTGAQSGISRNSKLPKTGSYEPFCIFLRFIAHQLNIRVCRV